MTPEQIKLVNPKKLQYKIEKPVDESQYYEWLKNKLINKEYKDLADNTGYVNLSRLPEIINHRNDIKLSKLFSDFKNSIQASKLKHHESLSKITKSWDTFVELVGKDTLEQLTLDDVLKYEKYLHGKGYKDKTIGHHKNFVKGVFNYNRSQYEDTSKLDKVISYFVKWTRLNMNSSSGIDAMAIDVEEFNELIDNAPPMIKACMLLCLNTGTLPIESTRLLKSDIDFKTQTIMTQRMKTGSIRKVGYLWDRTIEALNDYIDTRNDKSDVLFLSSHKGAFKTGKGITKHFEKVRDKCELGHIQFQHLRDTFETVANECGIPAYRINLVMGHSTGGMGDKYSHRRAHKELRDDLLRFETTYFDG